MLGTALALAAALAGAASPEPAPEGPASEVEAVRERIRTSLRDLDGHLARLDDLTASYADDAPVDAAARAAVLKPVHYETDRLNGAIGAFWPLWDAERLAQGGRLMGRILAGTERPEAGSSFIMDDTAIDDFKAENRRMQERSRLGLEREQAAYKAFSNRRQHRTVDRLFAAAAGAAAAALAAGALWARSAGRR